MCVVIDFDVVCLICLQSSKDMHPIYSADEDDPELQIAQKISILSELKIDENNKILPRNVCSKCFQDLHAAWRFRKNCQAAVTIFKAIINLENVQPGNKGARDLKEPKIKMPNGSQILTCTNTGNESEDNKVSETLVFKKTATVDEFVNDTGDKADSTINKELETIKYAENQVNEAEEFQVFEEAGENGQNEYFENDDSNLVEYYLTEEGISQAINAEEKLEIETKSAIEENATNLSRNSKTTRGRPRKQNLIQKELVNSNNVVQSKIRRTILIDSANSSEEATQYEFREVTTRKRKSLSPERKTPKICEICGNSYRFQHALNAHMRRHYNDKPFPCECCDKAFVSNVELRRHMRVHTGQKPYACQYCERRFSDFGSRIKHERTHTGERPYLCITCGKSFAYPHVLSVHLRTHTGEKRFRCEYCSKGFTKKTYLTSHLNQHHSSFQIVIDDTVGESPNRLKSKNFQQYAVPSDFINEEPIEDQEFVYDNDEESSTAILKPYTMKTKLETDDEVDAQEIDDFT